MAALTQALMRNLAAARPAPEEESLRPKETSRGLLKEIETTMALKRRPARKWRHKPLELLETRPEMATFAVHPSLSSPRMRGSSATAPSCRTFGARHLDARFRGHDNGSGESARKWRRKPLKTLKTRPEMAPAASPRFAAGPSPAYISAAVENRFGEPD